MPENMQSGVVFVGRKVELEQFEQALKPDGSISGLFFGPGVGVRGRVFLVYGAGGIGKTWLGRECLRRASQKKWSTIEIDWVDQAGFATGRAELMDVIAQALKGRYGEKYIQDYERVCERARKVREGLQRFQQENPAKWQSFSGGSDETPRDSAPALERSTSLTERGIPLQSSSLSRAEDNFIEWLLQTGQIKAGDASFFRDPSSEIAQELIKAIRQAAGHQALVVLLDGCQALPVALEEWLRDEIVCPLIKAGPPIIFIISGRQNQAHQRPFSLENGNSITVKGYADRLPDPAPVLWPLGPLSDPEIADLLARAGLPSEPYLVDIVQSRSAGVPFATQLVILALQKMGAEFVREHYFLLDSSGYPFDQIVILVTRSFLDTWLESADNLQQVRGLALVRPMDEAGLRAVWGLPEGSSLSDALANLARRSSFLEPGGRMLPVAREFIRQELRIKDPRDARRLGKLAGDALIPTWRQVSSGPATLAERIAMPAWRKCVLEMVNNLCWSNEQDALQFLAARVIESLLFDTGFAMQLVSSTQEYNHPADWFSARGQRVLGCLRMAAAREAGMKNNYDFLLEKCEELGLNNQHRAILHILLAQDPLPPDPANYMLRNLLIAEGQLVTGSEPSLQQVLSYGFADLGWQPGQEGAATRLASALKLAPQDGASADSPDPEPAGTLSGEAGQSDLEELIKLAIHYYNSNKFDEAKETYERAIQLDATNVKCWNGLGAVYNALNRMDEAIAAYQKAIELDPVFVAPWIGLGALFNDLKDSERAISAYKRALALDPGSAIPWNGLGNVYHATHENEAAIAAFKKAIELDPRFAHAWNGLGYVYRHENRLEEAITAFNKAVELHPLFALPWIGLGFVYRSQSNNEQAMMAYKKAIEINPRSAIPWNGLGYIYRDLRRPEEALAAFSKSIEFDPQYAAAWNGLGIIYATLRRREEALEACLKAVQIDPHKASYLNGLANAYREMGEIEQAMNACQRAITLEPNYAQPWYALGAMHGMLGQSEPAAAAFNKAIQSEPGWAYPWNGLGNVYFNQAKFDEALAAYLKATELDPNFAAAWSGLGSIHAQRGEDEKAVSAYRKALSLAPGDAAMRQALSATLKRLGREDDVASLQAYPQAGSSG